ncbi:thiamine biosynthesis protein ThiS [Candidatus Termititenax aidoneus]|uniref:Thiamine biosynthesis protein ThiS n=1 Tax=Termititenax aidoneus TaxID=2218524 RepID=A0A388T9C1_TERA1|nr:thiamine biosynthesis protein ThiS [Candidatus Termititenax aidoneus]
MNIILNGQPAEISAANVQDLVAELKLDNIALVAEHNDIILRQEDWVKIPLQENDRLELIKFCGGG